MSWERDKFLEKGRSPSPEERSGGSPSPTFRSKRRDSSASFSLEVQLKEQLLELADSEVFIVGPASPPSRDVLHTRRLSSPRAIPAPRTFSSPQEARSPSSGHSSEVGFDLTPPITPHELSPRLLSPPFPKKSKSQVDHHQEIVWNLHEQSGAVQELRKSEDGIPNTELEDTSLFQITDGCGIIQETRTATYVSPFDSQKSLFETSVLSRRSHHDKRKRRKSTDKKTRSGTINLGKLPKLFPENTHVPATGSVSSPAPRQIQTLTSPPNQRTGSGVVISPVPARSLSPPVVEMALSPRGRGVGGRAGSLSSPTVAPLSPPVTSLSPRGHSRLSPRPKTPKCGSPTSSQRDKEKYLGPISPPVQSKGSRSTSPNLSSRIWAGKTKTKRNKQGNKKSERKDREKQRPKTKQMCSEGPNDLVNSTGMVSPISPFRSPTHKAFRIASPPLFQSTSPLTAHLSPPQGLPFRNRRKKILCHTCLVANYGEDWEKEGGKEESEAKGGSEKKKPRLNIFHHHHPAREKEGGLSISEEIITENHFLQNKNEEKDDFFGSKDLDFAESLHKDEQSQQPQPQPQPQQPQQPQQPPQPLQPLQPPQPLQPQQHLGKPILAQPLPHPQPLIMNQRIFPIQNKKGHEILQESESILARLLLETVLVVAPVNLDRLVLYIIALHCQIDTLFLSCLRFFDSLFSFLFLFFFFSFPPLPLSSSSPLFSFFSHISPLFLSPLFRHRKEVEQSKDLAIVMREKTSSVCVLQAYLNPFKRCAIDLANPLVKLGVRLGAKRADLMSKHTEKEALEIDPKIHVSKRKLLKGTESLLRASELPLYLCVLCYRSVKLIEGIEDVQMGDEDNLVRWTVGAMLFLRFFCPYITSMAKGEERTKGVSFVGQFLMKLCCKTEFRAENCIANSVLKKTAVLFDFYCEEVVRIGEHVWNGEVEKERLVGGGQWLALGEIANDEWEKELSDFFDTNTQSYFVVAESGDIKSMFLSLDLFQSFQKALLSPVTDQGSLTPPLSLSIPLSSSGFFMDHTLSPHDSPLLSPLISPEYDGLGSPNGSSPQQISFPPPSSPPSSSDSSSSSTSPGTSHNPLRHVFGSPTKSPNFLSRSRPSSSIEF